METYLGDLSAMHYLFLIPKKDEHGRRWPHLSHILGFFIFERDGEAAYDEFLQQVAQLR